MSYEKIFGKVCEFFKSSDNRNKKIFFLQSKIPFTPTELTLTTDSSTKSIPVTFYTTDLFKENSFQTSSIKSAEATVHLLFISITLFFILILFLFFIKKNYFKKLKEYFKDPNQFFKETKQFFKKPKQFFEEPVYETIKI